MEFTKKEIANMRNISSALKDAEGQKTAVKVYTEMSEDVDSETGEVVNREKGYIVCDNGEIYGSISPTAIRTIKDMEDIIVDEGSCVFKVLHRQSGKKRDFISLELI